MQLSTVSAAATGSLRVVAVVPRGLRPSQAQYLRRRLVAALLLALVLLGGVAAVSAVTADSPDLVNRGGVPASAPSVRLQPSPTVYVVQPGDTLWSIAATWRGEHGQDDYVERLVQANGGTGLRPGQQIVLPG